MKFDECARIWAVDTFVTKKRCRQMLLDLRECVNMLDDPAARSLLEVRLDRFLGEVAPSDCDPIEPTEGGA